MPDIMILAKAVLQYFVHKVAFPHKTTKSENRDKFSQIFIEFLPKVNQNIYTLDAFCVPNIMTKRFSRYFQFTRSFMG